MIEKLKLNIQRFGASNYNSTTLSSGAGNKATLAVSFVENSTTVETNKSNVTVSGSLTMTQGSFSVSSSPTLSIYWHDNHNNTDVFVNSKVIQSLSRGNSDSVSGTIDVTHNADGSLSGYAFATWSYSGSTTYVPANGNVSTPLTALTNIPRASSLSVTTADIGTKPTFTITRAVDTFTHTLKYSFGSLSGTIATGVGTSYNNWTIPTTFYNQIPNSPTGTGTITCETYSGSTLIGTSTATLTVTVPSTAKPNVSVPTIVDTDTVSKNTIGLYVVSKSKLKFTFPAFSTNYGSTLGSYTLKINGTQVYNGTDSSYTMSTAISQTSNTYELIITDSRGISNTTGSKSFTAYSYTEPKITLFKVERNSTTATTVNITYSGTITNINNNNNNAKSFKIEFKQSTASSWTTITTVTDAYTKTNVAVTKTGVSDSNTFDFRITATDSYGSATASTQIGTSDTLLNFNANGKTMAFGKASELTDTIEVNIKSKFLKEVNLPAIANVKSNGTALTTTIQNAIQSSILKAAYPVGAIYKTTSSTNPATTFGFGTWEEVTCNDVVSEGDVTQSSNANMPINYGKYRLYANGDFEAWAFFGGFTLAGNTNINTTITLPFTPTEGNVVSSLAYGTGGYAWVNTISWRADNGTLSFWAYNTGGGSAFVQPNFYFKGKVDISGIAHNHNWKRTA